MKLIVSKEQLEKVLTEVVIIIKKKATLPIIQMAKMEIIENKKLMLITGTDLETTIVSGLILDEVNESRELCFDIHTLIGLLKSLPEQPIEIIFEAQLKIKTSTGNYDIASNEATDFPKVPDVNEEDSIIIENKYLERIVHSSSAAANDDLRPVMKGVFIELKNKVFSIVSTDANIMMVTDYPYDSSKELAAIIPSTAIVSIKSILGKYPDVNLSIDEKSILIKRGTNKIIVRRVEGNYVNYRAVLSNPENATVTMKAKIEEIVRCMKRLTFVSQNDTVKLVLKEMFVELYSQNIETGIQATETMGAEISGELTIGVSYNKFSVITDIASSGNVTSYMTDPNRAMLLIPEKDEYFKMLVMPIML